ncbi:hypothetical protein U1Q18_005945 [Sarracenia purpurea var. burkii]
MRVPENPNGDLPYPSISSLWSEQMIKMLIKSQSLNNSATVLNNQESKTSSQTIIKQKPQVISSESISLETANCPQIHPEKPNSISPNLSQQTNLASIVLQVPDKFQFQPPFGANPDVSKIEPALVVDQLSQCNEEDKLISSPVNPHNLVNQLTFLDQNNPCLSHLQSSPWLGNSHQLDCTNFNGLLPYPDNSDWNMNTIGNQESSVFSETVENTISSAGHEMWDHQIAPPLLPQQDLYSLNNCRYTSNGMRDLSGDESHNNQSDIYSCLNFDGSNGGSTVVDPSIVSSTIFDDFCPSKDTAFQNPSDYLVGNFSSSQDVQSQITSASLADSGAFALQEFPDSSGGASSSNIEFDESSLLQNNTWQQAAPPVRTYTKIQKAGSVGRSIDVSSFKNYDELRSAIECMFGLEGLLSDRSSGWKLVYVDFENDVLLVGDDPWEEFISCVRCIRILSPSEVRKMSEEGMQLLNNTSAPGTNGSMSQSGCAWDCPN